MKIRERIPSWQQLAPVYTFIVAVLYTWTTLSYFWRLSGWIRFLSIGKMLTLYAYAVTVNFAESILVLLGIVILSVLLPKKWLYERFISRGILMLLFCFVGLGYFNLQIKGVEQFPAELLVWIPVVPLVAFLLACVFDRIKLVVWLLEFLAEHMTVFLYIVIPISLLSAIVVGLRNLF